MLILIDAGQIASLTVCQLHWQWSGILQILCFSRLYASAPMRPPVKATVSACA